jgi:hypothetical protein
MKDSKSKKKRPRKSERFLNIRKQKKLIFYKFVQSASSATFPF